MKAMLFINELDPNLTLKNLGTIFVKTDQRGYYRGDTHERNCVFFIFK